MDTGELGECISGVNKGEVVMKIGASGIVYLNDGSYVSSCESTTKFRLLKKGETVLLEVE